MPKAIKSQVGSDPKKKKKKKGLRSIIKQAWEYHKKAKQHQATSERKRRTKRDAPDRGRLF